MANASSNFRSPLDSSREQPLPVGVLIGIGLLIALGGVSVALADLNALILSVGVIGALFVFYDFRIGVAALIVFLPLSASQYFPHEILGVTGLNPLNVLLLGTLVSCVFHMSSDRRLARIVPAPLVWFYLVPFVFAAFLGSRHVGDIAMEFFSREQISFFDAAGYLRDLLIRPLFFVLFAILVAAAAVRSEKPERFIYPLLVSVWVMCLLAIVFFALSGATLDQLSGQDQRAFFSPLGLHANSLGRIYAVAYALLLFAWAHSSNTKLSLILLLSMGAIVVALVLTFSRASFLAFLIVNAMFVLWRGSARTVMVAILAAAVLMVVLPGAVLVRMQLGFDVDLNTITAGRLNSIWLPLLPELWQSPVFGNGLGSIMWTRAMRSGQMLLVGHPHNAYLQGLLDLGIVGLCMVLAYWMHVWRGFRELAGDPSLAPELRGLYQGGAASVVALGVSGLVGSSLMPVIDQVFLWMAVGMMYGQRLRKPGR